MDPPIDEASKSNPDPNCARHGYDDSPSRLCSEHPKFAIGQRVYAPDRKGHLYLSLIQKISHQAAIVNAPWNYSVHYFGWGSRYDEWVPQHLIYPESEEMREKAERDRAASIKLHKKRKGPSDGTSCSRKIKWLKTNKENESALEDFPIRNCLQALVPKLLLQGYPGRSRLPTSHPARLSLANVVIRLNLDDTTKDNTHEQVKDDAYLCARWIPLESVPYMQKRSKQTDSIEAQDFKTSTLFQTSARFQEPNQESNNRLRSKDGGDNVHGRATRARQRRFLKEISLFESPENGINGHLLGCEQNLRFGKSTVHGWGVYTDVFIKAGDFIVEYRGILIGNAVADKREKLYERAKIGSDYMFRVDKSTVCDATKQGNLARFINASCTPNCRTKIVTTNGIKKIGIYAKRDINPGEELNYDYKFAPEKDESKRIPCRCASAHCRGYMNWDIRFDTIKMSPSKVSHSNNKPQYHPT